VLILDNDTTAMTGQQENPGTGLTLQRAPAVKIDIDVKGVAYLLLMIDGRRVAGDWADAKVVAGGRRDP